MIVSQNDPQIAIARAQLHTSAGSDGTIAGYGMATSRQPEGMNAKQQKFVKSMHCRRYHSPIQTIRSFHFLHPSSSSLFLTCFITVY
jgi:hypothetical protein